MPPKMIITPATDDLVGMNTYVQSRTKRALALCAKREGISVGQLINRLVRDNLTPAGKPRKRA